MENKDPKELIEKGVLYIRLVQLDLGIPVLTEAFKLSLAQNDHQTALNAIAYLMRCYAERDDLETLLKIKSELQELAFLEKVSLNSQFYYTLGICSFYQNKFVEARQYFNLASEKTDEQSVPRKLQAEIGLTIVDIEENKWDQARARIDMTHSVLQQINNPQLLMSVLLNEGRLNRLTGQYAKAITAFSKALEINKYNKNLFGYFYLLYEKAITYYHLGKTDLSKIYVDLLKSSLPEKDVARLEKLVNDLELQLNKTFEFDLIIDRRRCKIIEKNKGEINFGGQDLILDLFIMFTKNPGQIYSKEALAQIIWNEDYNSSTHDNKIYVTIKRLRTLVEPSLESPQYILRSRNGYYLNQATKVDLLV